MKDNFTLSLGFVLRQECVYAPGHGDDLNYVVCGIVPGDRGGVTKFGIRAASYPGLDIADLTLDAAATLYREGEWAGCRCDDLPAGIDTAIFDCAVADGVIVAGILLQRAIIACGHGMVIDGEIARQTARAANLASGPELMARLLQLRRQRYADLALLQTAGGALLKAGLARVDDLERFLF